MAVDQLHHSSSSPLPQWQTRLMSWFTHALTEGNKVFGRVLLLAPVLYVAVSRSTMTQARHKGVPGCENRN